jgi:peroxin-1
MINQVRAVSTLHPITVYPSPTSIASLAVSRIEPAPSGQFQFAKLSPESEIIVAPKLKKKEQARDNIPSGRAKSTASNKKSEKLGPCMIMRGISLPHPLYSGVPCSNDLSLEVYASPDAILYPLLQAEYVSVGVVKPTGLQHFTGPQPQQQSGPTQEGDPVANDRIVAKLVPWEDAPECHAGLSFALAAALGVCGEIGAVIRLQTAPRPISRIPSQLVVRPYTISTEKHASLKLGGRTVGKDASDSLKEQLKISGLLDGPLTSRLQLPSLGDALPLGGLLELEGTEVWIMGSKHDSIALKKGDEILIPESQSVPSLIDAKSAECSPKRRVVGIDGLLNDIFGAVHSGNKGVLVSGNRGSGKSSILSTIERKVAESLIHVVHLSCGSQADKPFQVLRDTLTKLFMEASWYAPSVLILDDIDKLIPAEVEHADSSKTKQLAEVFKHLCERTTASRPVSILASSQSMQSLNSFLIISHIFENTFNLQSPDKNSREVILEEAINALSLKKAGGFDVLEIAGSTEGYQPGDLWTLAERANHEVLLQKLNAAHVAVENGVPDSNVAVQGDLVTQAHFETAMKDFVPSALRGIKLEKSNVSWSDIGGLRETKRIILETIEWPTKYAPIFANCPLRLRSGLLLYGYPGCGKTLIASAIAAETGLNFISVKGPEILNKYIGSSEQSVRELFDRAQSAKPCVLFFDEFDSIAPKRGHDSTGVTDRVVNQMLTQMDGAEGLDGVYVLAATSRPDLIDSALLRPGRLDKSLLCDMPNEEDRYEILCAVQGKMNMAGDVSLREVAQQTEGYSGADLQALLYNAYLSAIHEVVDLEEQDMGSETNAANHRHYDFPNEC